MYCSQLPISVILVPNRLLIEFTTITVSTFKRVYRLELPFLPKAGSVAFWAVALIPVAVWIGALTPRVTTQTYVALLAIPLTGTGSYSFLQPRDRSQDIESPCWVTQQLNGTFTNYPTDQFAGKPLDTASSATTPDGSARNHSKFDHTKFRYSQRSYGAGAAVGLTDSNLLQHSLVQDYSYTEIGYYTTVNCIYNTSSRWKLSRRQTHNAGGIPNYYWAEGWFPNTDWNQVYASNFSKDASKGFDFYVQMDFKLTGEDIVSIGSHNSDSVSRYFIAIAAGQNYAELNKIQCELFFRPTSFKVYVAKASNTITVTPSDDACPDPEPRGILRSDVMSGLNKISMVATSLYTSTVGEALTENINNLQGRQSSSANTLNHPNPNPKAKGASNDTVLAVADSIIAMADDLLMSFAAAALTLPNATSSTSATVELAAVTIGSTAYILAIITINMALLLIVTAETLRTGFWAQLPVFDYTDVACMCAGLAAAADCTARSGLEQSVFAGGKQRRWNGDPRDKGVGRTVARLKTDAESEQLSVSLG